MSKYARWSRYQANVDMAEELEVCPIEKSVTWIFEIKARVDVHFYPTKNKWRLVGIVKRKDPYYGNFKDFWSWYQNILERIR
jgi:hypothetical protein